MVLFYVRKKETLRRRVFRRRRRRRGLPFEFRKRERERENNNNNNNNNKTRYRYHQYHAFVKVYVMRGVPFPCRGLNWNCLGYPPVCSILSLEFPHIARAYIYHPICGCCSLKSANNNVRRGGLHRRFQILRPTYHRPSIRPIFQRHNRFERKREIKHFGFHLLRPRDHEFKSGTITTYKRMIRSRCILFLSSFLLPFAFGNDTILRV